MTNSEDYAVWKNEAFSQGPFREARAKFGKLEAKSMKISDNLENSGKNWESLRKVLGKSGVNWGSSESLELE